MQGRIHMVRWALAFLLLCCPVHAATFMGDSLAVGMAAATRSPSVAVVGAHSFQLDPQIRRSKERTCSVLVIGTNDAVSLDPEKVRTNVSAALLKIKGRVVLVGPIRFRTRTHLNWRAAKIDQVLREVANEHGATFFSLYWTQFARDELSADGIHLTHKGYRRIGAQALGLCWT